MCGFIGAWHPDGRLPLLEDGLRAITHRGPDGEGWLRTSHCVLGHRRLSIVDVEGGHQPLLDEAGASALVHNGEIYNHREILDGLATKHHPRSRSDGEAALHAAQEIGAGTALARLRGMFALAHWDGRQLTLARDPLGIKPLYWSRHGGGVSFASEIKALLPVCPADSIASFPPGHLWTAAGGLKRLWDLPAGWSPGDRTRDQDRWCDALLARLDQAVRQRLMADVPVGIFLSGGLDSSVIAAMMCAHLDPVHSFSVGLRSSSDLERASDVATSLGTIHHEVALTEGELIDGISSVIWHLESWDPDLVRSSLPCWFLARSAARHVKVVLTGEGADELFAGYAYHRGYEGAALHRELRRSLAELHRFNLQRVDRMTMAHGLEARVPFLDIDVIDLALAVPPAFKFAHGCDKYLLRLAAQRLLPARVAWRAKEQFDQGSGVAEMLMRHFGGPDQEAAAYRRIFDRLFPAAVADLVTTWRDGRLAPVGAVDG